MKGDAEERIPDWQRVRPMPLLRGSFLRGSFRSRLGLGVYSLRFRAYGLA